MLWFITITGTGLQTWLAERSFDSDSLHTKSTLVVDPKAEKNPAVAGKGKPGRPFEYEAEWLNYTKNQ